MHVYAYLGQMDHWQGFTNCILFGRFTEGVHAIHLHMRAA